MSEIYRLENPCHPGGFLRRKVFEPRNLTVMGVAGQLGVTRQSLSDFLSEKTSLTLELSYQIEKVFGFNMEMMMDMQSRFDIAKVRRRERKNQVELEVRPRAQPSVRTTAQVALLKARSAKPERAAG